MYESSYNYLAGLVYFAQISPCAAEADVHVCVTGWRSLMFQNVFCVEFSQTYKLHHSSCYVLKFIQISTSP